MRFADSHVHLSDYPDAEAEIRGSNRAGIEIVMVSVDRATSFRSLDIARAHPNMVRAFVGVHPSEAGSSGELNWVEGALVEAHGCGEVGLDPTYAESTRGGRQAKVFEALLGMAEKAGKPVQVHTRRAENACLQILSEFHLNRVLLHWFEGEDFMQEASGKGYYISFGPALLNSKRLQRIATSFERERILTESDGPVPFKALGGVRGPGMVPSVVFRLAGLWRMKFDDAREIVLQNHARYLMAGGKG